MQTLIDPKKQESKYSYEDIKVIMEQGRDYWSSIHAAYVSDMIFSHDDGKTNDGNGQWDGRALAMRGGRPAEVYNLVNGFVRHIVNIVRQNPPAINVNPISDGASKKNARGLSGIIRAIEYSSGAQREYCDALENSVRAGHGVLRVLVRDIDGDDDVDFLILNEADPTKVFFDPSARKRDMSDAQWVVVESELSEKQYCRDYPDGKATSVGGMVKMYEVWMRETRKVKSLDPNTGYTKSKKESRLLQVICDDVEILEIIDDYPGKLLPFVLVSGPRIAINNTVKYSSLTREIMGIQKEVNFLKSEQIATIACAPKATFYGDNNVFESEEERVAWESSAVDPKVFLGHKPGASVNQFNMPQIPTVYIESVQNNIDIARAITGIYPDPTLQNGLNAVSGKAIKQQQAGQSVATYAYVDSLNYAIKRIGEIVLDILPHYWNDNRVRMAMGADGQYFSVSMGDQEVEGADNFDMAYGRYAVSISVGPSYASQRDALIEMLLDAIKTNPQAMTIAMPWIIRQINLDGSDELSDLLSLTLPSEVQQFLAVMKSEDEDAESKLKAALFQLQQLSQDAQNKGQMIQQLTAALENETAQLKSKEQELQTQYQIKSEENQTKIIIEQLRAEAKRQSDEMQARLAAYEAQMQRMHESVARQNDRAHQEQMADRAQEHKLEQVGVQTAADVVKATVKQPRKSPAKATTSK